ncbi:hypothetical protein ACJW30_08G138000 [Castanea mollissima]
MKRRNQGNHKEDKFRECKHLWSELREKPKPQTRPLIRIIVEKPSPFFFWLFSHADRLQMFLSFKFFFLIWISRKRSVLRLGCEGVESSTDRWFRRKRKKKKIRVER